MGAALQVHRVHLSLLELLNHVCEFLVFLLLLGASRTDLRRIVLKTYRHFLKLTWQLVLVEHHEHMWLKWHLFSERPTAENWCHIFLTTSSFRRHFYLNVHIFCFFVIKIHLLDLDDQLVIPLSFFRIERQERWSKLIFFMVWSSSLSSTKQTVFLIFSRLTQLLS